MRTAYGMLLMGWLACACDAPRAPVAAIALTDVSTFSVDTITLGSDGRIYALGNAPGAGEYQLRVIDTEAQSTVRTIHLSNAHSRARQLRQTESGDFYFTDVGVVKESGAEERAQVQLWRTEPQTGNETVVAVAPYEQDTYAISPDEKMLAFNGQMGLLRGNRITLGCTVGVDCGKPHIDPLVPFVFSPDSTRLLASSEDGLRLFATSNDPLANATPASEPLEHTGADVLLVRWDERGFQAITHTYGDVYLEDFAQHTARRLWSDAIAVYAWGDADHVFQATDAHCTDGGGWGGAPCHRVDFRLMYRSLSDSNDVHEVAHVDARSGDDITSLPDGRHFVWVIDGVLLLQTL